MGKKPRETERRKYRRRKYPPPERPLLRVKGFEFEVLDLSRRGIGFSLDKKTNLSGWVKGELILPDKAAFPVDGIIVRRQQGEIGLHLVTPLDIV